MDINLELYKVFYYVATTLSFSEASRQLFISQSAVSQAVKNLEKKLGHTLFVRSTKRVILTPEGELLLQHVKPALSMLNEGEAALSGEGNLTGQLRIGASDTLCRYFLIPYLRRFHKDHPEVRIKIINSTSIGCAELLENGQAELIVTNYPNSRLSAHTKLQTVLEFRDIFVANPDYFTMGKTPLSLENLLDYPILMLAPKSTTSEYLHQVFAAQGLKLLSIDGTAPSPDTIRSGEYPFLNPYYAVMDKDEAEDSPARILYDWLLGEEGQSLVAQEGYVSILEQEG